MIDYIHSELFKKDSTDIQIKIYYRDGVFLNKDIDSESVELQENLCSETYLKFGTCESNQFKFSTIEKRASIVGQNIDVYFVLNGDEDNPFELGHYKVFSDEVQQNQIKRTVTCYDILQDKLNIDVSRWYNSLAFPMRLNQFRDSLMQYVGIEQEQKTLPNDYIEMNKNMEVESLTFGTVIKAICEANGCFGKIGRDGKFKYIHLQKLIEGVYPSDDLFPSDDLYPSEANTNTIYRYQYRDSRYEDYIAKGIDKLIVRFDENDAGCIAGTGTNVYTIQGNFILNTKYGLLTQLAVDTLFNAIKGLDYRPFKSTVKGNPCFEVGDGIAFNTIQHLVQSYLLTRTMKGVQSLIDEFVSQGVETYADKVPSTNDTITQIGEKTNTFYTDFNETKNVLTDRLNGLQAELLIQAGQIESKVSDGEVISIINQSSEKISMKSNHLEIESDDMTLKDGQVKINGGWIGRFFVVGGTLMGFSERVDGGATGVTQLDWNTIRTQHLHCEDITDCSEISCAVISCKSLTVDGNSVITDGSSIDSLTVQKLYTAGSNNTLAYRLSAINNRLKALEDAVGISS